MIKNLSVKHLFALLSLAAVLLGLAVVMILLNAYRAHHDMAAVYEQRYQSFLLANELRQSSDDLTRMARTYVVTGDPEFERQFHAVLAIRNGEAPRPLHYERIYWDFVAAGDLQPRPDGETIALTELMRQAGFSDAEFAKLAEAQANSDALVHREEVAMHAVKGLFQDAQGQFTVQGEPDFELARQLMHDADYHAFKAEIMRPLDDFFVLLDTRTANEVAAAQHRSQQAYGQIIIVILVTMIGGLLVMWLLYHWLQRQLGGEPAYVRSVVETIADGNLGAPIVRQHNDDHSVLMAMDTMKHNLAGMLSEMDTHAAELEQSAKQLADTAGVMVRSGLARDHANQSIATAIEQMASSVAEITSTMEELSASSTQIADHSQSVVEVARRTLDSSHAGTEAMQQLLGRMNEIDSDNQKNLAEIVALGTRSKEISQFMNLIDAVVDQTKLIAFNAALEASSAGESGKRFSVVAAEIRRLADSVSESTREIEGKMQNIQDVIGRLVLASEKSATTIAAGLAASQSTAKILDEIEQAAGQTTSAAQKISLSTQQQKTASSQVVQALREIADASAHTNQAVHRVSNISGTLLTMSTTMRTLFERFQLGDTESRLAKTTPPASTTV